MVNKANKIGSNYGLAQLLQPVSIKKKKKNISFCKTSSIRFGIDILFKSIYCLEPVMNMFFFFFFISLVFSFKLVFLKLFFEAVFQQVGSKKHSKFNILHV